MDEFSSQTSPSIADGGKIQLMVSPSSLAFYINDPVSHKQMLTLYNPYDFGVNFKVYSTAPTKYSVVEPIGTIQTKKCVDLAIRHKEPTMENEGKLDKFRLSFTAQSKGQMFTGKKDVPSTLLSSTFSNRGTMSSTAGNRRSGDWDRNPSFDSSTSDWINQNRRSAAGGTASVAGDLHGDFSDMRMNETYSGAGQPPNSRPASVSSVWLLAAVGLVCILLLCLPTRSPQSSQASTQEKAAHVSTASEQSSFWITFWPLSKFPESFEVSHNCQLVAAYILGLISLAILR